MYTRVSEHEFVNAFDAMGREDNFSRKGRKVLFEHMEALEEELGEEIEFDPIAICCDFSEFETMKEVLDNYGLDCVTELYDNTEVIEFDDGIIVRDF